MRFAIATLFALLVALPASAQMEQVLPGTAPVTSYVNMKGIVAGYGALLANPAIQDLLEKLNVALPEASQLITEVGVAGHLRQRSTAASTMVLRGPVDQLGILSKLAAQGFEITASVYRGVPLHTCVIQGMVSLQLGFVDETCTLLSLDPSVAHPLMKDTIDTLRGTKPSFGTVTGWAPGSRALFSTALTTEAIATALRSHGVPASVVKHVQLASVDVLPAILHLAVDVYTTFQCDTADAASTLKIWLKRLNVLLVVIPGLFHGHYTSLHITQDGRRVAVVMRVKL